MSKLITAEPHGPDEIMVNLPRHHTTVVLSTDEASDLSYALDEALTPPAPKLRLAEYAVHVPVEVISPPPFHIGQVITLPEPNEFSGEELGAKPVNDESPQGSVVYIVGEDTKGKYGVLHGTEAVVTDHTSGPYLRHGDYAVRLAAPVNGGRVLVVPSTDLDVGPYFRFQPGDSFVATRQITHGPRSIIGRAYFMQSDGSLAFFGKTSGRLLRSNVDPVNATTQFFTRSTASL